MDKNSYSHEDNMAPYFDEDDNAEANKHKRAVRRLLEDRLERKRLRDELEDFDGELEGEFDWDEFGLDEGR